MSETPDEMEFRSLAAPGLEEDDVFAALYGLPGEGGMWGEGLPDAFGPIESPWDESRERTRRMDETLSRWPVQGDLGGRVQD